MSSREILSNLTGKLKYRHLANVTAWASGPARVGGRCGNGHLAECSAIRSVAFLRLPRTAVARLFYVERLRETREREI